MFDFQKARRNMVDCQIHTAGVISPAILDSFATVPRERYVPDTHKRVAYNDEDIVLEDGRILLEPSVHARMVQALDLKSTDVVLDIGGGNGYAAAILSPIVSTVIAVEDKQARIDAATEIWQAMDCCNVAGLKAPLQEGNAENAPYDAIIINGAVPQVPQTLLDQLGPEGRLIAVVRKPGKTMGEATLMRRTGNQTFSSSRLFDAGTPYLAVFAPKPEFQF